VEGTLTRFKAELGTLKRREALSRGPKVVEEAYRKLQELSKKAPDEVRSYVDSAIADKFTDFKSLYYTTAYREANEDAIAKGNVHTKTISQDAASKFMDVSGFAKGYADTFLSARDVEIVR